MICGSGSSCNPGSSRTTRWGAQSAALLRRQVMACPVSLAVVIARGGSPIQPRSWRAQHDAALRFDGRGEGAIERFGRIDPADVPVQIPGRGETHFPSRPAFPRRPQPKMAPVPPNPRRAVVDRCCGTGAGLEEFVVRQVRESILAIRSSSHSSPNSWNSTLPSSQSGHCWANQRPISQNL